MIGKFIEFIEFIFHIKIALYLKRKKGKPDLGDYIFDVGANKGSTSRLYVGLYKRINVIAFEPLSIFKFNSNQVKLIKVALGAQVGFAKFYVCKHNASSSLVLPNFSSNWLAKKTKILGVVAKDLYKEINVPVSTIDQAVVDYNVQSIFLLKIDTEGSELEVIKGASKSLSLGIIKNIQLELHDNDFRKNNRVEILELIPNYIHQKTIKHYFGSFTEEFFSLKQND